MKVALLTGAFPAGACGVGDYALLLNESLRKIGVESRLITTGDWTLTSAFARHREFHTHEVDIVQIHYPSLGFGRKLGPQGISLLRKCVVTLHEASHCHPLRQIALMPFSIRPHQLILFSSFERDFILKWAPWLRHRISIIPPPSNIRKSSYSGPRRLDEVTCFSLIRPGRGHEDVVSLARLIKAAAVPMRLRVVGTPQSADFIPYFEQLQQESASLPIIWDSGRSEEEVARTLASSSIAYLPYPDGAAELRSTLKAALLNGLAIVTTRGKHTPNNLNGVVEFCRAPAEALGIIRFLTANPEARAVLSRRAIEYVKDWTWERTAEKHAKIYERILTCREIQSTV